MKKLRKVIWVAGSIPEGITKEQYNSLVQQLADISGGELVEFGASSYMIIGDENAENKLKSFNNSGK